jgi:hypothetical protein
MSTRSGSATANGNSMRRLASLVSFAMALVPLTAAGHHSFAIYDANNPVTVTGVVREFRWTNPHSWLFVAVTDANGQERVWEIEHGPINMLSRQGWTRTTLVPGDRVAVEIHPAHDGQAIGRFIDYKLVGADRQGSASDYAGGTITRVPRPEPVPMSESVARDFNGIWINANGGIHFDTAAPSRDAQQPPLKPEYMAKWRQRFADAEAGLSTNDPTAQCLPGGFPRFLSMVFPGEILQAPHQLNWYAEWGEATVRIYLDGRTPPADLQPSYYGYTTGEWQGTTLVTKTVGLRGDTLVDTTGIPHSDQLTVEMRFSKVTPDYFEVAVTLQDPVVLERPWSTVKRYARAPAHFYVQEYACFEGNRYRLGANGNVEVVRDEGATP